MAKDHKTRPIIDTFQYGVGKDCFLDDRNAKQGFPVQRRTLLLNIKEILNAFPRETPFKDNCPGRKWFKAFMIRHPRLVMRTPEAITAASARVTEADIRKWFVNISEWFHDEGLSDILSDPSRVFNGDETSFYLHPKTRAVIAEKGSRNVYEVERANAKQNITVMFSFSAEGQIVDPLVILPGQRLRQEIARGFPPTWGLGRSENGWKLWVVNFSEYITEIFHPFLRNNGIPLPVVFFVDGHSSHVAVEVAEKCQELGIILIALYPNMTRITQPVDVSIFKPLKDQWRKELDDWNSEHLGEIFTLKQFGPTLKKAVDAGLKKDSIINGFRACGLCPFDADNVDYSKCTAINESLPSEPSNDTNEQRAEEFLQPFVQINLSTPNCAEISEQSLQPSVVDTGLLTPVIEEDRSYLDESGFGDTSVQEQVTTGFTARGETVLAEFTVSSRGSVCFDTPVHQAYSEKQIVQMLEGQSKQSSSQLFKIKDKNLGHDRDVELTVNQQEISTFQDVNNRKDIPKRTSLSDILNLPPAPQRTAQKQEEEQKKKQRINDRKEAKQKKDEERKKKKIEAELRKSKKKDCEKGLKRSAGDQKEHEHKPKRKLTKKLAAAERSIVKEEKEN
ncbi:uncharacterized protein LOC134222120 [Armigeres subalbatus]|uniref:uncharacterized protein LOC134222120 n=1 Tax=Armigeres subalbatus TaxID=124917 RepID=UPI002ED374EC